MKNNYRDYTLKTLFFAFSPLAFFYLAAGIAEGSMDLLWRFFLARRVSGSIHAADQYCLLSLWSVLSVMVSAGAGYFAVRRQFLAEKAYFHMNSLGRACVRLDQAFPGSGSWGKDVSGALAVLLMGTLALSLGINILLFCLGLVPEGPEGPAASLPGLSGFLLQTAVYAIYMPFMEEMLFRGTLFPRFFRIFGRTAAVTASSAVFGLYHGRPAQGFYAFVMGIVFALSYEKTGRFRVPWALHGSCNLMILLAGWTGVFGRVCTPAWGMAFLAVSAGGFFSLFWKEFDKRIRKQKQTKMK